MSTAPTASSNDTPLRSSETIGIAMASLAILVAQIALTRLLSVVLWYHFAFVAISLAMLGLALAGVGLYLAPSLLRATPRLLPWYCRGAALTLLGSLAYVLLWPPAIGQDNHGILAGDIVLLYLVLLVPFTLAGLAVSAVLASRAAHIGRLYASDLAGAGIGCLSAVPVLDLLGAPGSIVAAAIAMLIAGLMFAPTQRSRIVDAALLVVTVAALGLQLRTEWLEPRAMHGIPDADPSVDRVVDYRAWNSHSRIVVTSNGKDRKSIKSINIDGSATTGIWPIEGTATQENVRRQLEVMPLRFGSMPYAALGEKPRVLLIGPGGGLDLLNGIYYGAQITGVELNGLIHGLMSSGPIAEFAGNVYTAPGVHVVHDEARSWVSRTDERFDLIQASMIDTWAATAGGAFALAENALYTVEAFLDYHDHLTDNGIVHFMRWHESPPRQSLRVLTLIDEALRQRGKTDTAQHVIVLEEPAPPPAPMPMASLMWSKQPFSAERLAAIRAELDRRSKVLPIRVLCWPGEEHDNDLSRFLRARDRHDFVRTHAFDVSPTTDDRPFFFHTVRLRDAASGTALQDANEQAVAVLGSVLVTVLAIALAAFVLPMLLTLRSVRRAGVDGVTQKLAYFCALGLGFMLVEIPTLQRFGLYLGHPTWALGIVLGSLLLGAGIGGARTSHVDAAALRPAMRRTFALILAALVLLAVAVPSILAASLQLPFALRAVLTIALLLPCGAALGAALPMGVRALAGHADALVPWAWGMNGITSVLASVLAVAIGMQAGFTVALASGIVCYVIAAAIAPRLAR